MVKFVIQLDPSSCIVSHSGPTFISVKIKYKSQIFLHP